MSVYNCIKNAGRSALFLGGLAMLCGGFSGCNNNNRAVWKTYENLDKNPAFDLIYLTQNHQLMVEPNGNKSDRYILHTFDEKPASLTFEDIDDDGDLDFRYLENHGKGRDGFYRYSECFKKNDGNGNFGDHTEDGKVNKIIISGTLYGFE